MLREGTAELWKYTKGSSHLEFISADHAGGPKVAKEGAVAVDYVRRDVEVPRCNAEAQRPEAITRLGWRPEAFEGTKRTAAWVRSRS